MKNSLVVIARQAIHDRILGQDPFARLHAAIAPPQGCFVSLKFQERLRGCMGTITATQGTLEREVAENALSAAMRDPRFEPLRMHELERTGISIDLLTPLEPIDSPERLDPARFGLMVRSGGKKGLLLPDLPGVESVARQIAICREKAGIGPEEKITLARFEVERLYE